MLSLLALVACTGAYDGPAAGDAGAAAFGKVLTLLGDGLGGVAVCGLDLAIPCVQSEDDGDFLLEPLPLVTDVVVTMRKEGHLPTAYLHHTALTQEWRKTLMPDAIVNSMTSRVDTTIDPAAGHVLFILWAGPDYDAFGRVPDVTFTIDAPDAVTFYQGSGGMPDPALTATSDSGSGGVFNLPPGRYSVTFSSGDLTCGPWFSPDFVAGQPVTVPAIAGFASYMDLVCT